jgi:hypothetical protein
MQILMPKIRISVTIVTISAPIYLIVKQRFTTNSNRSADFSLKKINVRACARARKAYENRCLLQGIKKAPFGPEEGISLRFWTQQNEKSTSLVEISALLNENSRSLVLKRRPLPV